MDLTQIRFFLTLAGTLNFTRAAELCNVTQPALTKSIQRLESELGGPLLLRERGHTQLTALGETMRPLLQQTFDAAEQARRGALHFQKQDPASLRIGLGPRVEPTLLRPLLSEVRRRFPTLEVTLRQSTVTILNDLLLASRLDLALTNDPERLTDRANRWQVYADSVVAVFSDDHDLAEADQGAPLDADQLRTEPLVGRMSAESTQADTGLEDLYALAPLIRHRGETEAHVYAIVHATQSVTLSTRGHVLAAGLRRRTLEPPHTVPVWVAALAGRPLSRTADAFLRLARARDWDHAS